MTKVKIISGAYGYRMNGHVRAITREDDPIEVADSEAKRLVEMGVAAFAVDAVQESRREEVATAQDDEADVCPSSDMPDDESPAEGTETAHLDEQQLTEMTNAQLRQLAEDMGIDCAKLRTKAQLIAAIANIPLEDAIEEDGDEPPKLEAEEPV